MPASMNTSMTERPVGRLHRRLLQSAPAPLGTGLQNPEHSKPPPTEAAVLAPTVSFPRHGKSIDLETAQGRRAKQAGASSARLPAHRIDDLQLAIP